MCLLMDENRSSTAVLSASQNFNWCISVLFTTGGLSPVWPVTQAGKCGAELQLNECEWCGDKKQFSLSFHSDSKTLWNVRWTDLFWPRREEKQVTSTTNDDKVSFTLILFSIPKQWGLKAPRDPTMISVKCWHVPQRSLVLTLLSQICRLDSATGLNKVRCQT